MRFHSTQYCGKSNALSKTTTNSYGVCVSTVFWLLISDLCGIFLFFSHFSMIMSLFPFGSNPNTDHKSFLIPLSLCLLPLGWGSMGRRFYWPIKSNNKEIHLKSQYLTLFFLKSPSVISVCRDFSFLFDPMNQFNFTTLTSAILTLPV